MKKFFILALVIAVSVTTVFAQSDIVNKTKSGEEICTNVDVQPQFPGGNDALARFLSSNLRYPLDAQENKKEGQVICQFDVMATGQIENIKVIRSVYKALDDESVRVISKMPHWTPGMKDGKTVNTRITLPIKFKL
ncbi:MAG: energy transducer TonB [Paludibacteraceae bacterium]|nr:energy transducer TonB [Paludibacteraceae bacterium]